MERVRIHGGGNAWDYPQAMWLRSLLESGLAPDSTADLWIHVDENVPAAKKGQIDLILRGYFPAALAISVPAGIEMGVHQLLVRSIIATIEVKKHSRGNVELTPSSAIVFDHKGKGKERSPSSTTGDGQLQLFALKEYLLSRMTWEREPWLARAIFFPNLTEADLPKEPHFYIAADTTFEQVVRRLCISAMKDSYPDGGCFVLNSFRDAQNDGLRRLQGELNKLLGKRASTPPALEAAGQQTAKPRRFSAQRTGPVEAILSLPNLPPSSSSAAPNVERHSGRGLIRVRHLLQWFWRKRLCLFVFGILLSVFSLSL